MSYMCGVPEHVAPTRTPGGMPGKPIQLVLAVREVVYHHDNGISTGWEIVKEVLACDLCATKTGDPKVVDTKHVEMFTRRFKRPERNERVDSMNNEFHNYQRDKRDKESR